MKSIDQISEKYPLPDVAVIVCGRCKDRFRMTFLIFRKDIDSLVCPRCGNQIILRKSNQTALVPHGPGLSGWMFFFPPTFPHLNHLQLEVMQWLRHPLLSNCY